MTGIELLTLPSGATGQAHHATCESNTRGVNWLIALLMLGLGVAHVIGATILSRGVHSDLSPGAIAAVHTD